MEAAGHEVWWDQHIRGGSRFGAEIAEALKNAEVVLVLWSRASIESAWVNDEAAEGRDSGRLVPILIDECKPPLGFRQFQAIDLKGWTGRRPLPLAVLDAISARSGSGPPLRPHAAAPLPAGGNFAEPQSSPCLHWRSWLPAHGPISSGLERARTMSRPWPCFPSPTSRPTVTRAILPKASPNRS
ncbi:MAG: toll/interleukin-1 receptor domain-containing protein [Sphingomonas sp.]|nr:toll/interleukin-1 receptor domain-containing protein [Sphingomonas sp.]